jgi:hypothetical protein
MISLEHFPKALKRKLDTEELPSKRQKPEVFDTGLHILHVMVDTLSEDYWYKWSKTHQIDVYGNLIYDKLPGLFSCLLQHAPMASLTLLYRKLRWTMYDNNFRHQFGKQIVEFDRMEFHLWRVKNNIDLTYINSDWTGWASYHGNIPFLEQLIAHGCDAPDKWVCEQAVRGGRQNVLEWSLQRNMKWTARMCELAACYHNFPLLRWLHYNGCPWDDETTTELAQQGEYQMFRWAKERGCPCSTSVVYCVAKNGATRILDLFEDHGHSLLWRENDPGPCHEAATYGQINTLLYLCKHGFTLRRETVTLMQKNLAVLLNKLPSYVYPDKK